MARQPKKIEVPGDVVAEEEIASPITKSKPAKTKVQKATSEEPSALSTPDDVTPVDAVSASIAMSYTQRMGAWVLTEIGWQFYPDE